MAVDPREVAEMARIRAILLGGVAPQEEQYEPHAQVSLHETAPSDISYQSSDQDAMKEILRRFNAGVSGNVASEKMAESVARVKATAPESRPLRDALMTSKTKEGVKIGSWEIKVYEEAGSKSYDVVNTHTQEPIATDLSLYESAIALTKLLNFHVGITSPKIKEVLDLEDRYSRIRQEAAMFRIRMKQRNEQKDYARAAIAEDRYQESRTEALALREQLIAISKRL